MIQSFACSESEKVFEGWGSRRLPENIQRIAKRKLVMIDAAVRLEDLRNPPGNRLEALKGNYSGQHSIRINNQWRICFTWRDGNAHKVKIVDYH